MYIKLPVVKIVNVSVKGAKRQFKVNILFLFYFKCLSLFDHALTLTSLMQDTQLKIMCLFFCFKETRFVLCVCIIEQKYNNVNINVCKKLVNKYMKI